MKLSFYGAAREVTGSCHCVEANGQRILIDCGMQQGADNGFGQNFPFHAGEIDKVVVTHAHIDHSGRLPLLVKQGFKGSIYATWPTCELLRLMLRDSAHIQELEAVWSSRKRRRAGEDAPEPLYTMDDVLQVFPLLVPCSYKEIVDIGEGVSIRFTDAGHMLGSSYAEMWLTEGEATKKIVFSGDIGSPGRPLIRDPGYVSEADIVVMESTYGNRNHTHSDDTVQDLADVIESTLSKGGNVICPAFAVGRTQDLLYYIREIKQRGLVRSNPDFPVYIDSPLATAATKIYSGDLLDYLNNEAVMLVRAGIQPISFNNLHFVETSDESKLLNDDRTPKVIISSSGMCDAGRIRHHLKHNLWRRECTVVFTGFQALGTLGRILVDGAVPSVTLFGEEIAIHCRISNFRNLSSHADREGLLRWIGAFEQIPERVFVVHGEEETCKAFALRLVESGHNAIVPKYSSAYDLLTGEALYEGRDLIRRAEAEAGAGAGAGAGAPLRDSAVFHRLVLAGTRLIEVITRNRGGTNKDLAKFADQIDSLAAKWDR